MKIKPLGSRVLVKRIEEDEQIRGGIIIPDSAKEKSQEAEVVALGTGKADDKPFYVKKGDTAAPKLRLTVLNTHLSRKMTSLVSLANRTLFL